MVEDVTSLQDCHACTVAVAVCIQDEYWGLSASTCLSAGHLHATNLSSAYMDSKPAQVLTLACSSQTAWMEKPQLNNAAARMVTGSSASSAAGCSFTPSTRSSHLPSDDSSSTSRLASAVCWSTQLKTCCACLQRHNQSALGA